MAFETIIVPTLISLKIAVLATLLAFIAGGGFAWFLQGRCSRISIFLEGLISLPLVLPPTVLGFYLLMFLGKNGPIGRFLPIEIIFTPTAAVLAAAIAGLPLIFKTLKGFFEMADHDIIGAARLDASEWHILWQIRLPMAYKGIISGIMLAFLRSLGEFGATFMVAGNIPGKTQTLSLAIWGSVMSGNTVSAHILAALLGVLCLIAAAGLRLLDLKTTPVPSNALSYRRQSRRPPISPKMMLSPDTIRETINAVTNPSISSP